MSAEEPESAPIALSDLVDACEFVSASLFDEHQAYICKRTGRITFVAEGVDLEEDSTVPDDPDPADYLAVPHRRDLDLGKRLALSFVADELPGSLDKVRDIFRRKGAYGRFKQLLRATGTLDKWYEYDARATETALAEWCVEVGLTLIAKERPG
jgi:hypothetical protein